MSELTLKVRGTVVRCSVDREGDEFVVRLGGDTFRLRVSGLEPGVLYLSAEGRSRIVRVAHAQARSFLHMDGWTLEYTTTVGDDPGTLGTAAHHDLTAPMPGTVTQVLVREGDEVVRGQPLVIVEAMKMEHVIRAPRAGRVRSLRARAGVQVDAGAQLAEITATPDGPPR